MAVSGACTEQGRRRRPRLAPGRLRVLLEQPRAGDGVEQVEEVRRLPRALPQQYRPGWGDLGEIRGRRLGPRPRAVARVPAAGRGRAGGGGSRRGPRPARGLGLGADTWDFSTGRAGMEAW